MSQFTTTQCDALGCEENFKETSDGHDIGLTYGWLLLKTPRMDASKKRSFHFCSFACLLDFCQRSRPTVGPLVGGEQDVQAAREARR